MVGGDGVGSGNEGFTFQIKSNGEGLQSRFCIDVKIAFVISTPATVGGNGVAEVTACDGQGGFSLVIVAPILLVGNGTAYHPAFEGTTADQCIYVAVVSTVTGASREGINFAFVIVNTEVAAGNFVVDVAGLDAVGGVSTTTPHTLEGSAREIVFDGVGNLFVVGVTAAGAAVQVKLVKATAGNMVFDFSGDGAVVAAQIYFLQIGSALNVVAERALDGSPVIAAVEVMGIFAALDGVCNIAGGGS